jgi:murein DD-endopeptidase MepM/ murein hydrolase activator NlpD
VPEHATTASRSGGASESPVRLDTLPPTERPKGPGASASAGPAEARPQPSRDEGDRDSNGRGNGSGGGEGRPSGADMRGHVAAVAEASDQVGALATGSSSDDPGTGEIVWPADGRVLLRFGSLFGSRHPGIDIKVRSGTAVHAADWGRVVYSGRLGGYGKLVCVQHTQDLSTCYGQLSRIRVSEGDRVDSGEVIARSGCTGECYGPHLHFEVRENGRPAGPRQYLGPPLIPID